MIKTLLLCVQYVFVFVVRFYDRHACLHALRYFRRLHFLFCGFLFKNPYSRKMKGSGVKNGKTGTLALFLAHVICFSRVIDTISYASRDNSWFYRCVACYYFSLRVRRRVALLNTILVVLQTTFWVLFFGCKGDFCLL